MQDYFWDQLLVFRRYLGWACLIYLLCASICCYYMRTLFQYFMAPFTPWLPEALWVTTDLFAPFTVPLRCALLIAWYFALPLLGGLIARYTATALYQHERRLLWRLSLTSLCLFYLGFFLAYIWICPWALTTLQAFAPAEITVLTDIARLFDFVSNTVLGFGLAFQLPLLLYGTYHLGWISLQQMTAWRPYIIMLCLIVGMLLTPPDVFSQIALALPLWLLYEGTLAYLRWQS